MTPGGHCASRVLGEGAGLAGSAPEPRRPRPASLSAGAARISRSTPSTGSLPNGRTPADGLLVPGQPGETFPLAPRQRGDMAHVDGAVSQEWEPPADTAHGVLSRKGPGTHPLRAGANIFGHSHLTCEAGLSLVSNFIAIMRRGCGCPQTGDLSLKVKR